MYETAATPVRRMITSQPESDGKPSLKRRIKYRLEFAFVLLLAKFLRSLSRRQALNAGRKIGWAVYKLLFRRAGIAQRNLTASFPGISDRKVQAIIRASWENLGAGVGEFVKIPDMPVEELRSFTTCQGLEHLQKSQMEKRGAVLLMAHYGAWELGAKFWPASGIPLAAIARKVKNPLVNDWVTKIRSTDGVKMIFSRNGVREAIRWLKDGKVLVILMDHRVTEGGLKVPFFGRLASTTSLPGILALRYQVPIHPVRCWREGDQVKYVISPAMDFSDLAQTEANVVEAITRMNGVIEGWVRNHPEDWLWIHNRWKMTEG